jgi:hypothetical protein
MIEFINKIDFHAIAKTYIKIIVQHGEKRKRWKWS